MKILSLFDGMACGMIAMMAAGVQVEKYVAYEVDKYAIKTTQHNFPMVEEMGDVFKADFAQYKGFDFIVGGSPCTYWSIAQTKNRETEASGLGWELFSQYVRALREVKPKMFIYENNKSMSKAIRESITETFGFEPICINSALVSAQNRQRLYWCGIRQEDGSYRKANIEQPEDRGILLKDILETNTTTWLDKAHTIDATYYKGGSLEGNPKANGAMHQNSSRLMAAEEIKTLTEKEMDYMMRDTKGFQGSNWNFCNKPAESDKSMCLLANLHKGVPYNVVAEPVCVAQRGRNPENPTSRVAGEPTEQRFEAREDYKTNTLTTVQKDNMVAEPIRVGTMPSPDGILRGGQYMRIYSPEGKAVTINTGKTKTGSYAVPIPECFRVKEATKQGYTDIEVGGCVDMSMINSKTRRGRNMSKKSNCLQTSCGFYQYCGTVNAPIYEVKGGMITVKGKQYPIKLIDGNYIIRKLTVKECMRLQTVPEWYEFPVSNSQAYKMLGNGWTVEVIAHLIREMLGEKNE